MPNGTSNGWHDTNQDALQDALPMSMPVPAKSVELPKKGGITSPGLVANSWQQAAKTLQAAQAMTMA